MRFAYAMSAKPLPKGPGIAMPAPNNVLMVPRHVEPRYAYKPPCYNIYHDFAHDGLAPNFLSQNLVKKFRTWGRNFLTQNFLTSMGAVSPYGSYRF